MPASLAQEDHADDAVDDGRAQRDGQTDPQLLQGLRVKQSIDCGVHDERRRDQDHDALSARGEVLRLAVAEVVALVRGLRRRGDRDEREDRGHQVDHRLQGIREQAHRAGEEVGDRLHADGDDGGGDGQPRPARQRMRMAAGHAPSMPRHVSRSDER